MTFFDQIFNKLFASKANNSPTVVKEVLKRTDKERLNYQQWQEALAYESLIQAIAKAYYFKKTNIVSPLQIHLFRSTGANGFALSYDASIGQEAFRNIFDYFKNQILALDYQLKMSERQISDRTNYVETKDKYYLKPSIHLDIIEGQIANQLYGNITLEHVSIDDKPSYLKVLVAYYVDYQFSKALDYDDFIEKLFAV